LNNSLIFFLAAASLLMTGVSAFAFLSGVIGISLLKTSNARVSSQWYYR
jgi:hypothetical protein